MTPANDMEKDTCDSSSNHTYRNVKLKVLKDVLSVNHGILQRKKEGLKIQRNELDDINYSVWAAEDKFCNDIWNFSLEHDFNVIFNLHPAIQDIVKDHECEYNTQHLDHVENYNISDSKKNEIVQTLKEDIDALNNQITIASSRNVEKEIDCLLFTLNNLKSFSEELLELIRLTNPPNTPVNSSKFCNAKRIVESQEDMFKNESALIVKKQDHLNQLTDFQPPVLITTVTTSLETITTRSEENEGVIKNERFGKFVVKKQSSIALKLAQIQRHFQ